MYTSLTHALWYEQNLCVHLLKMKPNLGNQLSNFGDWLITIDDDLSRWHDWLDWRLMDEGPTFFSLKRNIHLSTTFKTCWLHTMAELNAGFFNIT